MSKNKPSRYKITIRGKKIQVILDKVLFFRFLQKLHGRFWGITGIIGMLIGMGICFAIRPELFRVSTAFSDFGKDVRTVPYFAGSIFFAAYGLWRWRNYLSRTLKRPGPVLFLITLTIVGMYLVVLMPVSWKPWPYRIHLFGVTLAGISMALTVVLDGLLTKSKKSAHIKINRFIRFVSFALILVGGYLTYGSVKSVGLYNVALLGESLILLGYGIWVYTKTKQGEGSRSRVSKLLQKIIVIN